MKHVPQNDLMIAPLAEFSVLQVALLTFSITRLASECSLLLSFYKAEV